MNDIMYDIMYDIIKHNIVSSTRAELWKTRKMTNHYVNRTVSLPTLLVF